MTDTNLYWRLRGNYAERKAALSNWDKTFLESCILDAEYNDFLRSRADCKDGDKEVRPGGKKLPYIGWFWRRLEFSDGKLPIGDCGEFIGFMSSNKWDYPERVTTPEEFASIMVIIDEAMRLNEEGSSLDKIISNTENKLDELWPLLQAMKIN